MTGCTHPLIRNIVKGKFKGRVKVNTCLVAHLFEDGSSKPPCMRCPDCDTWIDYEEQEKMKEQAK